MESCKSGSTPSLPHQHVLKDDDVLLPDPTLFHNLVGALQYLTFTRPDIALAVNIICQFMHSPTNLHFGLVKFILRYLQATLHHGLTFSPGSMTLSSYYDADWRVIPIHVVLLLDMWCFLVTIMHLGILKSSCQFLTLY